MRGDGAGLLGGEQRNDEYGKMARRRGGQAHYKHQTTIKLHLHADKNAKKKVPELIVPVVKIVELGIGGQKVAVGRGGEVGSKAAPQTMTKQQNIAHSTFPSRYFLSVFSFFFLP